MTTTKRMTQLGPFGVTTMDHSKIRLIHESNEDGEQSLTGFSFDVEEQEQSPLKILVEHDIIDFGTVSPPHPITLTEEVRKLANIPDEATHFLWAYPLAGIADLKPEVVSKLPVAEHLVIGFIVYGGFMYVRQDRRQDQFKLVRVNAIGLGAGLFFSKGKQIPRRAVTQLEKDGRFQTITVSTLKEFGATQFCWINPGEKVGDCGLSTENGAFVYLYDDNKYVQYFEVLGKKQLSPAIVKKNEPFTPFALKFSELAPPTPASANGKDLAAQMPKKDLDVELKEVKKEIEDLTEQMLCRVCCVRVLNTVFSGCGHSFTCTVCLNQKFPDCKKCPVCDEPVKRVLPIFI